jgi:hypothetical protein
MLKVPSARTSLHPILTDVTSHDTRQAPRILTRMAENFMRQRIQSHITQRNYDPVSLFPCVRQPSPSPMSPIQFPTHPFPRVKPHTQQHHSRIQTTFPALRVCAGGDYEFARAYVYFSLADLPLRAKRAVIKARTSSKPIRGQTIMRPFHSGWLGEVLGCGTRRDAKLKLLGSVLAWVRRDRADGECWTCVSDTA